MKKILFNILSTFIILFLLELPDYLFSLLNQNYLFTFSFNDKIFIIFAFILTFLNFKTKIIFFAILFFLIFLELLNFNFFGKLIAPYDILLFFEHFIEIADGFKDAYHYIFTPFIATILPFLILFFIFKFINKYLLLYPKLNYLLIIALLALPIGVANKIYIKHKEAKERNPKLYTPAIKNIINSISYFSVVTLPKHFQQVEIKKFKPLTKNNTPKVNIIFIIGESFRYKNCYLLGYQKNNMPLLSTIKDKIKYKKTISSGTMTKVSVSYMLNGVKNVDEVSKIFTHNFSIFKLAKENNFSTSFVTAQSSNAFKYIYNLIDKKHIDNLKTPKEILNSNQFATLNDIKLLNIIQNIDLKKPNLIVLQMNGSHFPYSDKSPKKYKLFKNEYDNSIVYTDYVLYSIINYIKRQKNILPTFIFFVSDHGELLGEYGHRGHGRLEKEVFEVPFIFYSNQKNTIIKNFLDNQKILSQNDITKMIYYLLGYKIDLTPKNNREVFVTGRDLSGYVGYKKIKINDENISISKTLYK